MTEGQDDDARLQQIVELLAVRLYSDDDVYYLLNRLDALTAERVRAEEANTAVIRANAEEIADLEDKRDELEAKVNALTAQMECRNELTAHIRALTAERDAAVLERDYAREMCDAGKDELDAAVARAERAESVIRKALNDLDHGSLWDARAALAAASEGE